MYQCFHCLKNTVVWNSDYSFEDLGIMLDGVADGIVHICNCSNCGAEIEYRIPIKEEDKEETKNTKKSTKRKKKVEKNEEDSMH